MQNILKVPIYVDDRISSYENFFENDWANEMNNIAMGSKKLGNALLDLFVDWRGASNVTHLPRQLIEHIKSFHDGFVNSQRPSSDLLNLSVALTQRLGRDFPELNSLDPALQRRIQERIVKIGYEIQASAQYTPIVLPLEEIWRHYIGNQSYALTIWSSQRIVYIEVYNAYESFLAQCMRIALRMNSYRIENGFAREFESIFGPALLSNCWSRNEVFTIKQARHCLSHSGGKINDKLLKAKHNFKVVDKILQITPNDTKAAYHILKECVKAVLQQATEKPEFR